VEAVAAKNAGEVSHALTTAAFALAFQHLPQSYAGDSQVRLRVHKAATMAGIAFSQAGLGLCHALSHSLGGAFHVPHGRLNAVLLPTVVVFNTEAAGERYAALARAAGLGGSATAVGVRNLKNGLVRLRRELELPATLAQAGISPRGLAEKMDAIIDAALADPCCATNPRPCDRSGVRWVLEQVMGHG
jgi:alcohol dehydrogenase class IV